MPLMQLTELIQPAVRTAFEASGAPALSDKIGFVVLGVILTPVILLTIAGLFEYPRKSIVPELFLGAFITLIGAMVGGFAVIGFVLRFVVPQ